MVLCLVMVNIGHCRILLRTKALKCFTNSMKKNLRLKTTKYYRPRHDVKRSIFIANLIKEVKTVENYNFCW